jgi:thymidylate synthase (FAD)
VPHQVTPEAEALLDKEFSVLDRGFVRLVDYMGGDARIVAAARVSYGAGTKTVREDRGLIHYLIKNPHTSPFEQVVFTFHAKMPIFVARQWIRHRTARVNEISGRYSVMAEEFYLPKEGDIRFQSRDNKQGRSEEDVPAEIRGRVLEILTSGQQESYEKYTEMVETGIARELARIHLPLSLYTEWYWQIDLHNFFHFLKLRLDSHAQLEIREYARVMFSMARAVAPVATEAFETHTLRSVRLSGEEADWLRDRLGGETDIPRGLKEKLGIVPAE